MTWNTALAESTPLLVEHVGFLRGDLRIYLRAVAKTGPHYVLQLEEVASFADSLHRGEQVRISDSPQHGCFGFWLPADDPHHQVKIKAIEPQAGFILALARRVFYRFADESEALNWPG